ncbi:MAG: hypothetical protein IKV48_03340 [Eggerthellaceae bacterium]|nr:hypothetical protein [Eggerthellaceae bacterium]
MNPILAEIYSTVIPSAPYVIAAYALIWIILLVYVVIIMRGNQKAQKQMMLLEEQLAELKAGK